MVDSNKIKAMTTLKREFEELKKNPPGTCGVCVGPGEDKSKGIFQWRVSMTGPEDSCYRGGLFWINVDFPEDYPIHRPEVQFRTKIFHCNIGGDEYTEGHVCISSINNWESKPSNMRTVLWDIYSLFYKQNPDDPMNVIASDLYKKDKAKFEQTAKDWVIKYAYI